MLLVNLCGMSMPEVFFLLMLQSGQIVGLGTGSTSALFIEELGQLISKGKVSKAAQTWQSMMTITLSWLHALFTLCLFID